jgi:hypothetical protein
MELLQETYIHRQRSYEDIIVKEVFPTIHSIEKPFQEDIKELSSRIG